MEKLRRPLVAVLVIAWGAILLFTLVVPMDAKTRNATWGCGSLLNPRTAGGSLAAAGEPVQAQLMLLAGETACAARRDQQLGRALALLFPGLMLGISAVGVLRGTSRTATYAERPPEH